jgi:hypothetical protein
MALFIHDDANLGPGLMLPEEEGSNVGEGMFSLQVKT